MKRFFFLAGKRLWEIWWRRDTSIIRNSMYHHAFAVSYSIPMKGHFLHHVVTPRIYLLHTSRRSTLYLTRGVICYIRSEEFYHRIHHQEFLRKVCYQGILKCAAHFRGNSPAKRRYIFVMTKRICKFSLPWDFD